MQRTPRPAPNPAKKTPVKPTGRFIVIGLAALFAITLLMKPWGWRWTPARSIEAGLSTGAAVPTRDTDLSVIPRPSPVPALAPNLEPEPTAASVAGAPTPAATAANTFFAFTDSRTLLVGYRDRQGQETIPARFDWGGPFRNGRAKVELAGQFGFIDREGHFVVPAEFDSIFDYTFGLAVAFKDGYYFYIDETGRQPSSERYDYAWPHTDDGVALVKREGLYGYVDLRGQLIVPTMLEETFGFNEGLAVAKVNGQYGFLDRRGRFVVTPQYDYAWPVSKGQALVRKGTTTSTLDLSQYVERNAGP